MCLSYCGIIPIEKALQRPLKGVEMDRFVKYRRLGFSSGEIENALKTFPQL